QPRDHLLEQRVRALVLVLAVPEHRGHVERLDRSRAAALAPEPLERACPFRNAARARHRPRALDLALLARGQRAVGVDRIGITPEPEQRLRALLARARAVATRKAELQ